MTQEQEHHREGFAKAQDEYHIAAEEMKAQIDTTPADHFKGTPYRALPAEEVYLNAAAKLYSLEDEARNEAYRLEGKHKRLIESARMAERVLVEFETNELDMHG